MEVLLLLKICDGVGYLHDHQVQGRILLPGAAMFEMSNAASKCLGSIAKAFVVHSINLQAPCELHKPYGSSARSTKLTQCCISYISGQVEVNSTPSTGTTRHFGRVHMTGWSAQFNPLVAHWKSRLDGDKLQGDGILSIDLMKASAERQHLAKRTLDIYAHLRSLSEWLHKASLNPQEESIHRSLFPHLQQDMCATSRLSLPTCTAMVSHTPPSNCGQPSGYAMHPAILDAATHTAAAFVGMGTKTKDIGVLSHYC